MRICLLGLNTDLVLSGSDGDGIGGEDVQHALLASGFRGLGHEVSVVVLDRGQAQEESIDGVRVLKTFRRDAGIPGVRFFHPRITSWWSAMARANADVYYQSPAGMVTGLAALFCKMYGRLLVFRVASDVNCIPGQQLIRFKRDRMIYEYGLRSAHLVAAQTSTQIELLREHYGVASHLVPMATELPEQPKAQEQREIDVLWVSNLRPAKRPDVLLDLAARLPRVRFVMVGGACPGCEALYESISRRAAAMPNVELLGFQPNRTVNELLEKTKVFVNTSDIEGFPNTFLQAWARGVPVVSFFDPDRLLSGGLGLAVESLPELERSVGRLLADADLCAGLGARARQYVWTHHRVEGVVSRYMELIQRVEPAGERVGTRP